PVYADLDDVPESPQSKELSELSSGEHSPSLRRSSRPHVPNRRYMGYMLLTDGGETEDYAEACQTPDASKWEFAMK
ncbi:hypothetical protein A2U01_0099795, partial [Trifolium medium]|nr:hypothetical protein [Trifolium medium]